MYQKPPELAGGPLKRVCSKKPSKIEVASLKREDRKASQSIGKTR